jgi:NodT family efflux transporter outer membrane factor (OMF) lipoprotein
MKPQTFLIAFALTFSGCSTFGPSRHPPEVPKPEHYSVEPQKAELPSADGISQKLATGTTPVPKWWEAYESDELNALVEEGLKNSPSLASAQHTLQAAREELRAQIGNTEIPSLDGTFIPGRVHSPGVPTVPDSHPSTFNIFAAEISTAYNFDFFGQTRLTNRALAGQVQQQAYELEATRRALATNIVKATINVASLQEQVAATERLVELGEQRARDTAAHYKTGSSSRDQMLSAEQDAANAAATLPSLRAKLLAARHAQAVLLGRTPDRAPPPMALDSLRLPQDLPVSVPSELLHQRPDILAAEAALRASADKAGAATAALFPSLTLSASYGRGGFDWSSMTSPASGIWSAAGVLTQPLFHGGALRARRRGTQDTYEASVSEYKKTVLSAFQSVADTLAAVAEDANTVTQTQRAEVAAHDSRTDTESRYKLGATPFYATLTAGQQYENAHIQYVSARASRLADTATLFDSMGEVALDAQSAEKIALSEARPR